MKFRKSIVHDFEHIEREFFDVDETTEEARICLRFEKPENIFDTSCLSKTPIFGDDFDEWLMTSFEIIPAKYRIALDISLDDSGEYTPEVLQDIFRKNLLLSARSHFQSVRTQNRIAYGLIAAGFVAFVIMMLVGRLWGTESFWHEIFFYLLDIATTVLFWEAAGILLVESRKHKTIVRGYRERFSTIEFHCGE